MLLGINSGPDPIADLEAFVAAFQITFPVLLDNENITSLYRQSGAISPFPLDYVIDQSGNVAYLRTEYDPDAMAEVIEELLATGTPVRDTPAVLTQVRLDAAPNPFNPLTTIRFEISAAGAVTLDLYDARGHLVRRLLNGEHRPAGSHELRLEGRDDAGRELAAGVYLLHLSTDGASASHKVTLVR